MEIREDSPWVTTPREIIHLASGNKRNTKLTEEIEQLLDEFHLFTHPAFSNTHLANVITVQKRPAETEDIPETIEELSGPLMCYLGLQKGSNCDPIPRLSRLDSANLRHPHERGRTSLISIQRDAPLEEAITLMIKCNYSQLPIMNNPRKVEGMVSWRSIGKAKCLGKKLDRVYDCREEVEVVSIHTPLLEVVERVLRKEVVLVRDTDDIICGIITNTDITGQFLEQAEPFFLIEQIEKLIRIILSRSDIPIEDMLRLLDPNKLDKKVQHVSDLTFGQYLIVLQNEEIFRRINLPVSRTKLMEYFGRIHEIRNEVMHFAVDETSHEDLKHLRETLNLLQEIME